MKKGVLWWLFFAGVARNTLWIAAESWLATRIQNFGSSFLVLLDANDLVAHRLSISGVYLNHEVLLYRSYDSYVRTLSTWWPRCGSSRAFPVCHGMDKGSEPKGTALWVDI